MVAVAMGGEAGSARGPALWQLAAGAVLASGAAAAFYWYRIMSPEERKRMHEQARRLVERGMGGGRLGGGEDMPAGKCVRALICAISISAR